MNGHTIRSLPVHESNTVSWIHIGDTHIANVAKQNDIDLGRIVDEINTLYSRGGIDFVFLPGDIADDGSATAFRAARAHLSPHKKKRASERAPTCHASSRARPRWQWTP